MTVLGRYEIHDAIASGGMATVHFGRLRGAGDFARIVAVKRLHAQFAREPEFVAMFLDEARLAARIQDPHVVAPRDLASEGDEVIVVFDYVHGESLSRLLRITSKSPARAPLRVASAIVQDLLLGLHAAHEARSEAGEPLGIVHRDVSPQNVLVGADGVARLIDFGIAKARARLTTTRDGEIKGKLAYMAPEQLRGKPLTRAVDLYAASVVLWETIAGRRLFTGDNEGEIVERVLISMPEAPSAVNAEVPAALDAVTLRGLSQDPAARFATAREMAAALEAATPRASADVVAEWVRARASDTLARRAELIAAIESVASSSSTANVLLAQITAARSAAPSKSRRGALLAVGGAAIACATIAAALVVPGRASPSSPPLASSETAASIAPSAVATVALVSAAPPPTTAASAAESAALPVKNTRAPLATRPRAPKPDCKVPFTLDDSGRKIYKRECL